MRKENIPLFFSLYSSELNPEECDATGDDL